MAKLTLGIHLSSQKNIEEDGRLSFKYPTSLRCRVPETPDSFFAVAFEMLDEGKQSGFSAIMRFGGPVVVKKAMIAWAQNQPID